MIFRRVLLSVLGPKFCSGKFVKDVKIPLKIFQINEEGESYTFRNKHYIYEFGEVTFVVFAMEEEVLVARMRESLCVLLNRLEEFGGEQLVVNYQIFTDEEEIETTILGASLWHLFSSPIVSFSTELFRLHVSKIKEMYEEINDAD